MDIPTICTVRDDHIGEVQIKSKSSMSKLKRGEFSYAYDDVVGFHCVRWNNNSVVTTLSNSIGPNHLNRVERFSRNEKKWIPVARPNLIKVYNSAMGGVDLLDSAVGTYCTKIKGEKWWWPPFTNTLSIWWEQLGTVTMLSVQMLTNRSWLSLDLRFSLWFSHVDEIVPGPSFWKTKVVVHDSNRLTGHSHRPTTREKQQRCALPGCSTFCEECDVALCIKEHFKTFHTTKWYHLYICCSCSYDVEKYISISSQSFYSFSCAPHPYQTVPNPAEQPGPLALQFYVPDSSYRPLAVTLYKIYNCSTPYQNQKIPKMVFSHLRRFSNLPLYLYEFAVIS